MATVRYLVNDVDAAVAFYHGLGFTTKERWGPPFEQLVKGDLELWISGPGTSAARPMPDGAKPVPGGWNRLVITVTDLPALVARLRDDGYRFRNDIVTGGRQPDPGRGSLRQPARTVRTHRILNKSIWCQALNANKSIWCQALNANKSIWCQARAMWCQALVQTEQVNLVPGTNATVPGTKVGARW